MKRLLIICFLICSLNTNLVYAASGSNPSNNQRRPFEEIYFKYGYKSVEDALKECERHFKRELKLPIKVPPVPFTHRFGRFNDNTNSGINNSFEVEYLNEKNGATHYMIDVRPIEHKMNFRNKAIRIYKLKDGTEAVYLRLPGPHVKSGFNLLVFQKEGWQYRLSVDMRIEDKVPAVVLLGIADSIKLTYPTKLKDPLND